MSIQHKFPALKTKKCSCCATNSSVLLQVRYGGRTELATGEEETIADLCRQLELVLNHGLRDQDTNLGLAVIRSNIYIYSFCISLKTFYIQFLKKHNFQGFFIN